MFEYVVVLGWGNEFVFSSEESALAMSFLSTAAKHIADDNTNSFKMVIERKIEQDEQED